MISNSEGKEFEDGILTSYEAQNLDLTNTKLVVLSACETGKGVFKDGEGVYGLKRSFQTAGAITVVMSLWKVDDAATKDFMNNFYDILIQTGDKSFAFRESQKMVKDKYSAPFYWGAFVLTGE